MQIKLITIGQKMPSWVNQGYSEYAKRLPRHCQLQLIELPMPKRQASSTIIQLKKEEALLIRGHLQKKDFVIALDEKGKPWSTLSLAQDLKDWFEKGQDIALLIGGPDGLDEILLKEAKETRSLSALTLPHPLVRIILAEQIYRAYSLLQNHPYHRA